MTDTKLKGSDMKLTPLQVEAMRERIVSLDTEDRREAYRSGLFPRAGECKDVNVRYRWDLFHASRCADVFRTPIGGADSIGSMRQADITSDHIDTGLRLIVPPLACSHEGARCAALACPN